MIETDLQTLAQPAGRKPGTPGHREAAQYLLGRFDALGLTAYEGLTGYEPATPRRRDRRDE